MPYPTGWVSPEELARMQFQASQNGDTGGYYNPDDAGVLAGGPSSYSSYDPITLPQQYWPSEDQYNRTAEHMRSLGVTPDPRGVLDPRTTAAYGQATYDQESWMDSPLAPALVMMGGAAFGGAFGGAGSGLSASSQTFTAAAPVTSVGSAAPVVAAGGAAVAPNLVAGAGGAIARRLPDIISGASSLIGGRMASNSAEDAVDAMTEANREALGFQRESRDIALDLLEPDRQAANAATARMLQMQGLPIPASLQQALDESGTVLGDFDVTETPGYQDRFDRSMRALETGAFARGGGMSGGFANYALRYAQDYASNEYNNIYSQLATLAGRSTAGGGAEVALNFGGNAGRISMDTGAARASGYVAQGNAWQNALDQVSQLPWDQWFPRRSGGQGAMAASRGGSWG